MLLGEVVWVNNGKKKNPFIKGNLCKEEQPAIGNK